VRKLDDALHTGDPNQAQAAYRRVAKVLDRTAATGTIHKNAASRRKSRLAKRINKLAAAKTA